MTLRRTCFAAFVAALLAGACGGGGGISGTGAKGTMRLALTDAPACGFDAVHVTIEKIRVHQSASAADADAGWSEIVLPPPAPRLDLLTLTNGVLYELGSTDLPAGRYTQMRIVLAANGSAPPYANAVTPTGGSEHPLTTPTAQQSGLKLNLDIEVPADRIADFVLDFDACKSVVVRGASSEYNLQPVIAVIPVVRDAGQRVVGQLDPAIVAPGTVVSLQQAAQVVKSTVPLPDGQFVLYPVPVGAYDLVIGAAGRATAVMTGVPVSASAFTVVSSTGAPILPPATVSPLRAVTGSVSPASAAVRALQALTAGPTVEVAWAPVDATSGAFAFGLPSEPPARTAFVANPSSVVFVRDTGAGARYTIEAAVGATSKRVEVDASAAVAPIEFIFP